MNLNSELDFSTVFHTPTISNVVSRVSLVLLAFFFKVHGNSSIFGSAELYWVCEESSQEKRAAIYGAFPQACNLKPLQQSCWASQWLHSSSHWGPHPAACAHESSGLLLCKVCPLQLLSIAYFLRSRLVYAF